MTRDEMLDAMCVEMAKIRDCSMYFRTPHDEQIVDAALTVMAEFLRPKFNDDEWVVRLQQQESDALLSLRANRKEAT